jgi:hypothetical protein
VVGRQVVLGQQVLDHGGLGDLGELGLIRIPVLAAEGVVVLALFPGDVVVRVPVFPHAHVAVDERLDDRLQLV